MGPVQFTCSRSVRLSPRQICEAILRVDRWSEFQGYGPIPGVREAEYELRTEATIGSRIRVQNTDGSSHVEEIVAWSPDERVCMRFGDFSPPLDQIADHFVEEWRFSRSDGSTAVSRSFSLHPRNGLGRIVLWLVSFALRRAVNRHLRQIENEQGT